MLETINRAYKIFGKYKLNNELDVCTHCCVTIEEKLKLESLNLKLIPFKLIYVHNTAATSSKPPIEEFKYFLPRYMELISENKFPSHSIELSLKRIQHYEKEEFTNIENAVIDEFCQNYFEQVLSNYPIPENEDIAAVLIMLNTAKCNMTKILNKWQTDNSETGNRHFVDLIEKGLNHNKSKLRNPFSTKLLDKSVENWLNDGNLYLTKYSKIKYDT